MSESDKELSTDSVQIAARLELDAISPLRATLLEEHTHSFRWLMASLLAINGGGLIAIKDAYFKSETAFVSGFCFYVGLGLSLLVAWLGQRNNRQLMTPLTNIIVELMRATVTGVYDMEAIESQKKLVEGVIKKGWKATLAGWLSFAAFSAGVCLLAGDHRQAYTLVQSSAVNLK